MPDIAMCTGFDENRECPFRNKCYRATAKPSEYRQTYFAVLPLTSTASHAWCRQFVDNADPPKAMTEEWP